MNKEVTGWWIKSLCREELTDLWFIKQTGNGKPIELMSYHWLFLMYLNLASPPQQRQPAYKLPMPGWVKGGEYGKKWPKSSLL